MISVNPRIHDLSVADGITSRIRIYGIPRYLTSFRDQDIEQYGTLWKYGSNDTDSGGRLTENGITLTDLYNKDQNIRIGTSVCNRVTFSIFNDDHAFDNYTFERIYIYIDVWDDDNATWWGIPLGAFDCEKPASTVSETISITANDVMLTLEQNADYWFNSLIPWANGVTLYDILKSLSDQFGYGLVKTQVSLVNGDYLYEERPFYCEGKTYRQILEYIAELAGGNAFFNHEGLIDVEPFTEASWRLTPILPKQYVTVDGDAMPSNLFNIDIATYEIPQIWIVEIWREGAYVEGTGAYSPTPPENPKTYYIKDNPLAVNTTQNSQNLSPGIIAALHQIGAYHPISAMSIMDMSIEAGDIIRVIRNGVTYNVPIFQQTWSWRGGHIYSTFASNGAEETTTASDMAPSAEERKLNSFESGFVPRRAVASGTTEEVQIYYSKAYRTIPNVVATLFSMHTESMWNCSVSIWNRTLTGFSLRLNNDSAYQRSLGACWIAMENYSEPQESDDPESGVVGVGVVGSAIIGQSTT